MKTFYCYLILAQLNFIMDSVNILLPTFSRRTNCIFIIVVASASFAISLDGDFVFDDTEAIVNNKDIRLTTPILQVFENDFWGTNMLLNKSHKSYRPVTTLTFKLNLLLSDGELTPFKFKLTNLLLHVIASLLCSSVYEKLLDGSHQQTVFLSSLLFAIHPIHTEAVANVVGRADILCTIFGLIAFLFYCRTRHVESYLSNIFLTLISILFVGFSMFSKEQGITIFSICVLYDLILVFKIRIQDIAQYISFNFISKNCDSFQKSRKNEFLKTINMEFRFLCIRIMLLIASGMFLMYLRLRIMGSLPNFQVVDNPASFIENSALRTINYFYIYSLNAWLLLCPDWLCFDWSMGCVPLIESFSDFRLFVAVTFIFLLSGVCLTVLNLRSNELQRASLLSLIIILMTFLPASNLFFRVGFVVAERVLYLPSIGYCLLISIGVQKLASCVSSNTWHTILRACVCLLLIVFLARSVRRSAEWRTEKDLFRSGFRVCPLNAKVHYNMGKVADNRSMAMKHYREAIALNPNYYPALNNLANILKDIGELDEAEMYLRKAVQLKSDFAAAWMNLGIVLSSKKQFEESEQCFFTALKHRSHYPDCYYNLGNLYLAKKMFTGAYNAWQKAISQNPKHAVAWNNIIIMLDSLGKYGEAEEMANKALKLIEDDAGLHFNLANALGKLSRFEDSEESFLQAIRLKPDQPLYYVNLGVLYHRWKKFEKAKLMYYRALELNPNSESALRNLKMLQ